MKKLHPGTGRSVPRALAQPAALLTVLLAAWPAVAAKAAPAADPARDSVKDPHTVSACGGGPGIVTLQVDGRQLSVTRRDGDHVTTTVVDMDQVGRMVGDAVGEAVAAMDDLQLQVRLGQDNRVNVSTADSAFEVDLDRIMTQVAAAVQTGLKDIDTSTWTSTGPGARSDEELQNELADLQAEMRALREELQRLRDQTGGKPAGGR